MPALLFAILIVSVVSFAASAATDITQNTYADEIHIDADTVIHHGATVYAENIFANNSVQIKNNGAIGGTINVCANCHVTIQNSGTMNVQFNVAPGATITQIIKSADDITSIGLTSGFDVSVGHSDNALNLSDIHTVSSGAKQTVLRDANIYIDNATHDAQNAPLQIYGENVLHLRDVSKYAGTPILQNVSGPGIIRITSDTTDRLHAISTHITNGELYATVVRETDYLKILQNNTGQFLNELRNEIPNDATLMALDNAQNMAQINDILSHSARTNPILMMRPILTMMELSYNETQHATTTDISVITADNFNSQTTTIGGHRAIFDKTTVNLNINASGMKYQNDINSFSAKTYGANAVLTHVDKQKILRIYGGATLARFDSGPVCDGNTTTTDPTGIAAHAGATAGYKFMPTEQIGIAPFVGATGNFAKMLNQHIAHSYARSGMEFNITAGNSDLEYEYFARVSAATNGDIRAMLSISAWSPADGAGGMVSAEIFDGEYDRAVKISAGAHITF